MAETKIIQISLRLTPYVYEILKKRALETGMSLNSEVIQAILEHCESEKKTQPAAPSSDTGA